jgi:hypothetical protein
MANLAWIASELGSATRFPKGNIIQKNPIPDYVESPGWARRLGAACIASATSAGLSAQLVPWSCLLVVGVRRWAIRTSLRTVEAGSARKGRGGLAKRQVARLPPLPSGVLVAAIAALPRFRVQALVDLFAAREVLGTLQEGQIIPG